MVAHQGIGVDLTPIDLYALRQDLLKFATICIIGKNIPALIATRGDLVPGSWVLDSQRASHSDLKGEFLGTSMILCFIINQFKIIINSQHLAPA